MQDLRQGNYIDMNEEYDRHEFNRAGRMSDCLRVLKSGWGEHPAENSLSLLWVAFPP